MRCDFDGRRDEWFVRRSVGIEENDRVVPDDPAGREAVRRAPRPSLDT
jgi:hypothetical protein